jgi:hypothetical protein
MFSREHPTNQVVKESLGGSTTFAEGVGVGESGIKECCLIYHVSHYIPFSPYNRRNVWYIYIPTFGIFWNHLDTFGHLQR